MLRVVANSPEGGQLKKPMQKPWSFGVDEKKLTKKSVMTVLMRSSGELQIPIKPTTKRSETQ